MGWLKIIDKGYAVGVNIEALKQDVTFSFPDQTDRTASAQDEHPFGLWPRAYKFFVWVMGPVRIGLMSKTRLNSRRPVDIAPTHLTV